MKVNETICGFSVLSREPAEELGGALWLLEHRGTGARLAWLDRPEENKTFSIAFQTQPWDDTGVFHILEHSVLCGSERYPAREPFVEMMKSSLNTFINALTYPDRTIYPVSSRNDQDFLNLVRVYMDAVLRPRLHTVPEIFAQEGWHYELDERGEPGCRGVVFNEMKGAYASPDELAARRLNQQLFPASCYRFDAGGDPEHIPELTYGAFTAAHRRLYHPSNAYIFLDGALDAETVLSVLDGEYLSAYGRAPAPGPVPMQEPVDGGRTEAVYELGAQEDLAGRCRLAEGFVACAFDDRETQVALKALADALCGDNRAPLKRRLLEEGLARDVEMSLADEVLQPWVFLQARDVSADRLDDAAEALRSELGRLADGGLDRGRVLASLDNLEFRMRQRDYGSYWPQGVVFATQVMASWLYGGDPAEFLQVGDLFDRLRKKCESGWFEELLRRVLLDNPHRARLDLRPSHEAGREKREAERARLREVKESWDAGQEREVRSFQARLQSWQEAPDSPEALSSIPRLRPDQVPREPERLPLEEAEYAGVPVLRHELVTGGIAYLELYFALDDLTGEELSMASFLCGLLNALDTETRPLDELKRLTRSLFGSLRFAVTPFGRCGDAGRCRTFLTVSAGVLEEKLPRAVPLLAEILRETVLTDGDRVRELLVQRRAALTERIVQDGHSCGLCRVSARLTAAGAAREYTGGIAFLRWLRRLEKDLDARFPALGGELTALAEKIFTLSRLTLGVTAAGQEPAKTAAGALAAGLPRGDCVRPEAPVLAPWPRKREGFIVPSDVGFACMGGAFPGAFRGEALVAGRAASLGYLWNAVRVQGGAYGVGTRNDCGGAASFYSYRDPSPGRTLERFREAAGFLENVKDADLDGFIIGAVAESDPLLTPRLKGRTADALYWQGITGDMLAAQRREMLETRSADLPALAAKLRDAARGGSVCVLGPEKLLEDCAGELDSVEDL